MKLITVFYSKNTNKVDYKAPLNFPITRAYFDIVKIVK